MAPTAAVSLALALAACLLAAGPEGPRDAKAGEPATKAPAAPTAAATPPETAHFGERAPTARIGEALPVGASTGHLRVGIADVPPWTIPPSKQVPYWSGLASQVWKQVASELKLDYEIVQLPVEQVADKLAANEVDVLVGGMAILPENLTRFTITAPFDQSGISIATRVHSNLSIRSVAARVAQADVALWMVVLTAFAMVFAFLFWLAERRRNPPIEGPAGRGLRESFWWSVVTLTTVGYGDRVPVTRPGRAVAMAWMAVGFVLITVSAGVVASTLTVASLQPVVTGPSGLVRARIGVVPGTTGEGYILRAGLEAKRFDTFEEAINELADGRLDAVVGSTTTLVYLSERSGHRHLKVLPRPLVRDFVGLGMRFGLDPGLEKRIDLEVLKAAQSDEYRALRATMMGDADATDDASPPADR